jgi:hypothetical protein
MGNFVCFALVFGMFGIAAFSQGLTANEESTLAFFDRLFSVPKKSDDASAIIREYIKKVNNSTGIYTDQQMADTKREFKKLLPVYVDRKVGNKDGVTEDQEFDFFEVAMKGNAGWRAFTTLIPDYRD